MKRFFIVFFFLSLIIPMAAAGVPHAATENADRIEYSNMDPQAGNDPGQNELMIESATICWDIVNREVVDAGDTFPSSVEKLYCFTKVTGARPPTTITHIWYYEQTERARVRLAVNSSTWRTYSSKRIRPRDIGQWFVEIVGPGGKILKTLSFQIIP
jgi:hypothetical protein